MRQEEKPTPGGALSKAGTLWNPQTMNHTEMREENIVKRVLSVLGVSLLLAAMAAAQSQPKAEVFAGYQLTHFSVGGGLPGVNFNGWNAALSANVSPMLAITGDLSGAYKNGVHDTFFMGGPTVSIRSDARFTPFVHGLFGVDHASAAGFSDNAMAMALGGGLDYGVGRNIAVRVGQFDYLMTHFAGTNQNNFRYSAGVVIRFE